MDLAGSTWVGILLVITGSGGAGGFGGGGIAGTEGAPRHMIVSFL